MESQLFVWQRAHCVSLYDSRGQFGELARRYSNSPSQVRFRQEQSGVAEKTLNVTVSVYACIDDVHQVRANLGSDRAREPRLSGRIPDRRGKRCCSISLLAVSLILSAEVSQ